MKSYDDLWSVLLIECLSWLAAYQYFSKSHFDTTLHNTLDNLNLLTFFLARVVKLPFSVDLHVQPCEQGQIKVMSEQLPLGEFLVNWAA